MKLFIRKNKSKMRVKKRHFQLLEIMVALFLLLVCIAPMLHIYTNLFKAQQALVRSYQQDHWVHLIHAKITEQLYKRQIPLADILQGKSMILEDAELKKVLDPLKYGCMYKFTVVQPTTAKGQKKAFQYLCRLVITMKDFLKKPPPAPWKEKISEDGESTYEYFICIKLGTKDKKESSDSEETE